MSLMIKSKIKDYSVFFENGAAFLDKLKQKPNTIFIIDENVYRLHKKLFEGINPIILEIAEEKKSLESVTFLYDKIMEFGAKKNINIVSVGGGITQDITGFVTDSLYRGVNWIFAPTTLLAQCDSCIGSKTSLNYKKYKNLIGTFYPPSEIYILTDFLDTLTEEDYYSGIGETAKLFIMAGEKDCADFISYLPALASRDKKTLLKCIQRCMAIKKTYIEQDEFDVGIRNMLNYGHCLGHALEFSTQYAVPHGQAVVAGMILANLIAVDRGVLSAERELFLREKVLIPILKTDLSKQKIKADDILAALKQDKKRTGAGLPLIMVDSNYKMVKVLDVTPQEVLTALKKGTDFLKWQIS